ncbi:Ig-like domain-containing protein [Ancylomarina sp. YFZ004]
MNNLYIKFSLLIFSLCLLSGSLLAQINMPISGHTNITVTGGENFYDSNLGENGNYKNGESGTITFKTTIPGAVIRVVFEEFSIEEGIWKGGNGNPRLESYYDYFEVRNGASVIKYEGNNSPGTITSSTNSVSFHFYSDGSVEKLGWKAKVEVLSSPCSVGSDLIWSENFEGANQGWTTTPSDWKNDHTSAVFGVTNLPTGGNGFVSSYLDTKNGRPQQYGVWTSNKISISNYSDVRSSIDVGSWGDEMENDDYLRIYYSVDGGEDVEFSVNGNHKNDISAQTTCTNIPEGNELTLKVVTRNTYTDEHYYIDNVIITGETKRSDAVTLEVSSTSIDEYGGTASITASIFEAQALPVTVHLSYSGADASSYSVANQIVIPAGATSASITFSATDNDILDGDRDVLVQITSVDNGVESGTQRKTITIVDDEEVSEIEIPFQQRTSQNTPYQKIYNIKGDFTMIGNTNLTLKDYYDSGRYSNNSYEMIYVDTDSDASTFNSSSATLTFSEENGAKPQCSDIIYAGLYWTGRADSGSLTFTERINGSNKRLDKRKVLIKHAGQPVYQSVTANTDDVYYPDGSQSNIYAAYAEVTDYVHDNGIGEYFVADMALSDGDGDGTGLCGGWGLVVVYKNSKMKWRDVTLYDGYAYVSHSGAGSTSYNIPISGFKAVQSGDVNIKLGLMASEGDVVFSGDFIEIQNAARDDWTRLSHGGNTTNNFFNSSIETGGNDRSPNLTNNTGVDISMFDVPNDGNLNIANGQTRTKFKYGTSGDFYAIFALAMAVDAYVPEAEATNAIMTIGGDPIADGSMVEPGQEIVYQLDIRNRGTEAVDDLRIVLPIAYTTDFVNSTATVAFSPAVNNYYYDPSEGATGSIIWEIGNLPIPPEGPDQILGSLTYTVKVTEDCAILGNPNCDPSVGIGGGGGSSGTGANSGTSITGFSIIQGYVTDGDCVGEPITTPIEIQIDAEDYVKTNCTVDEIDSGQEYFFCNMGASGSIPIGEVSDNFPTGCRFYDSYPIIDGITEEFTVSNDFLADVGTRTYYAVPPGYTSCFYTFKITVKNISSVPSISDLDYCEGNLARKLQATPSLTSYKLYYYTDAIGGTPHVSLTPNTDVVGNVTYYVAEGESSTCLSPNRVAVNVKVNSLPTVPTGDVSRSFCESATIADLVATSASDVVDWYSTSAGGSVLNSTDALSSGTYYAEGRNVITGCVSSSRLPVSVSVNPSVSVNAGSNQRICHGKSVVLTPIVSPASGSFSYEWRIQGGTDILTSIKDYSFVAVGDPNLNSTVKYEVTATDVHTACSSTDVVSITNLSTPAATTVTSSNPSCPTLDSGSITFSFSNHPDRTNIQFSINGSSGTYENSADNGGSYIFSGLVAGDYDVYVRWGNRECPLDLGIVTLKLENISDMSFSYTESAYCSNELDPTPSITTSGGIFTSTDGLSIDSTTGVIDLSASTSGTYVVTYTIDGDCGGSSIQEVTINTSPKPIGIFFD